MTYMYHDSREDSSPAASGFEKLLGELQPGDCMVVEQLSGAAKDEASLLKLLEDLEDGMSFDQWIYAFCQRKNVRTRNEFKFSIVERNFANFVDWLTDEGKVEVRREFCAKHYFHREK